MSQTPAVRTYRELFALAEFRVLFLCRCLTLVAVSIQGLALGTTTYAATGSALLTALAMFGGPLITLAGSATILGLSDSLGARAATMVMPAAYAVACALQAIPHLPWGARFAILAIPYLAGSATSGSTNRLLRQVVPPSGFVLARSTLNVAVGVAQVLGYALGGALLLKVSTDALFIIAAAVSLLVVVATRVGITERPAPPSASKTLLRRTNETNRLLLTDSTTRFLFLALWLPSGLITGCEALFIPYAGAAAAGYLFAATAAGMLVGDIVIGRFTPAPVRNAILPVLLLLQAIPYLAIVIDPSLPLLLIMAFTASTGIAAALPLQGQLADHVPNSIQGQAFGIASTGTMASQAIGAAIGGILTHWVTPGSSITTLALASLLTSSILLLTRPRPANKPAVPRTPRS
jgi:predicted MFS family arabinose efflux permease